MLKSSKGITLVALVITIIVLLILAGVTLSFVLGDSSITDKAENAVDKYENASLVEQNELDQVKNQVEILWDKYYDKSAS